MAQENENENTEVVENKEDEPTLLDAVSAAIDEETIDPDGADDDTPTEAGVQDDESEAAEESTPAEEASEDTVAGDSAEDTSGEEAGEEAAVSEEKPAGDETPASDDGAGDTPADAEADTPTADSDPINDPIPEDLKKDTKDRMQTLITRAKAGEEAGNERDELIGTITDSGSDAEQFGATLGWLTLYNSSRIEDRREALKIMQQATAGLAQEIGEPVAGVDILANHADLKTEVETGDLTQARAEEIAAGRDRVKATEATAATGRDNAETARLKREAIGAGKADLDALEVILKIDKEYAAKKKILLPTLGPIFKTIHPSRWAGAFKTAYDKLELPAAPTKPTTPKPKTPEPLRPKQPAGEGTKRPTTMLGAIEESLGEFDEGV